MFLKTSICVDYMGIAVLTAKYLDNFLFPVGMVYSEPEMQSSFCCMNYSEVRFGYVIQAGK